VGVLGWDPGPFSGKTQNFCCRGATPVGFGFLGGGGGPVFGSPGAHSFEKGLFCGAGGEKTDGDGAWDCVVGGHKGSLAGGGAWVFFIFFYTLFSPQNFPFRCGLGPGGGGGFFCFWTKRGFSCFCFGARWGAHRPLKRVSPQKNRRGGGARGENRGLFGFHARVKV